MVGPSILFITVFLMAIIGTYLSGHKAGQKKMLSDLNDKRIISDDIYVLFLKSLEK
jgi:hypothetical protein